MHFIIISLYFQNSAANWLLWKLNFFITFSSLTKFDYVCNKIVCVEMFVFSGIYAFC